MTTTTLPLADAAARDTIATALDDTLIVEAAAGTGKTTELVGRVVTILAEGRAEVGQIVAVTFTEKAAGELKLRLRERLDRARTEASADSDRRARLDQALKGLEEAHVSTIHGFCADLLRERPVEAGVDPLFEVLTESTSARLFDEAFGRWLQQQLVDPPEGVRRALRRTAFGRDEGAIDRIRKAAWDLAQWRDFTAPWTRQPFDRGREIEAALAELHEFASLTRQPLSRNDPLHAGTEPARRVSEEVMLQRSSGEEAADYDGWEAALVDLSRDRAFATAKTGRGSSYASGVGRDRVIQARASLKARLDQFRMAADADLAALLQRDLRGAIDRYDELKSRRGALDFLDLLLAARNLVRDNAMVRRGFQTRFKRIFVDEFQDTDPLQAEILLLLAADDERETDWRRSRPRPGTLFLVGDPKQSIYRFRRADVGVYREVCDRLTAFGARLVRLNTSFRSVPGIQACVNAAFAPVMTGDPFTLQAPYVPLAPHRAGFPGQPAIVTLPVPEPYKWRYVSAAAIEQSMPSAVAAFVDWVLGEGQWLVTERSGEAPVAVSAKHVCLLFRRFISWQNDVTRPYVEALEARGIPHVLVGGRAFHEREEVEALRAALAAIEWPDDELSVFATLRGPFFAVGDEALLEWTHRFGHTAPHGFRRFALHPFRIPPVFDADVPGELEPLRPIAGALALLKRLHRRRNYVPVAETLHELLGATRAHVGFALRTGGEQALANAFHVAELARQFESGGGISFRGFVEELRIAAATAQAAEAPILEEDSDGVRMMTVHKAKGLEFPIVILADLTCKLSRAEAGRWIDPDQKLCALKLGGWAPMDLLLHDAEEAARDRAEGERLAYVAATRARDVLVVPAIGDEVYDGGWLDPLMPAIYPPPDRRRNPSPAPGCPAFPSKDSVLTRPEGDPAKATTVAPGMFEFGAAKTALGARRSGLEGPDPQTPGLGARRSALDAPDPPMPGLGARRSALDAPDPQTPGLGARRSALDVADSQVGDPPPAEARVLPFPSTGRSETSPIDPEAASTGPDVPSPERRAPSADPNIPSPERRTPSADPNVPGPERRTPSADPNAPSPERRAPSADPNIPSPERRTPSADPNVPSAERRAPSADPNAPSPERRAPSADPNAPSPERRTPSADPNVPNAERRAPSADPNVPSPERRTPSADPNVPSPERRTPSADPNVPGPERRTPSADPNVPGPQRRTPSANLNAPDPRSPIPDPDKYQVVWWDPRSLILDAPNAGGLRRDDLIAKDGDPAGVERRMGEYRAWQSDRAADVVRSKTPTVVARTATDLARHRSFDLSGADTTPIQVIDLPRPPGRPFGPRFGTLVHATLATVALDADADIILRVAQTQARILLTDQDEARAAAETVRVVLADPLFDRIRAADACSRECPVLWCAPDGSIVEGTVDVVFEEGGVLTIVDFKTDREPSDLKDQYERQLRLYCRAFAALRGRPVTGVLVRA